MAEWAFVALGSNLGDRNAHLAAARRYLAGLPDTTLVAESTIEETEPLGGPPQGPYLNQMVLLRTDLSPKELLTRCLEAERLAGRARRAKWDARTLDLDIVRFGDHAVQDTDLTIPHPELSRRPFWQRELMELMPHAI